MTAIDARSLAIPPACQINDDLTRFGSRVQGGLVSRCNHAKQTAALWWQRRRSSL